VPAPPDSLRDQIRRTATEIEDNLEQGVGVERWKVFWQVLDTLTDLP